MGAVLSGAVLGGDALADGRVLRGMTSLGWTRAKPCPRKLSSQPSPVSLRRRRTLELCVCACIWTRSPVDQATIASASTLTYLSGVTCIISGCPEVIRATLPRPETLSWYLPEPEMPYWLSTAMTSVWRVESSART